LDDALYEVEASAAKAIKKIEGKNDP